MNDADLDEIRTRLVGIESRIDSMDRHVVESANGLSRSRELVRRRAGWILLWSFLGLGSCGYQNATSDVSQQVSNVSSQVQWLEQKVASHDEVMELCHLLGQVAAREKTVPAAATSDASTDCLDEAKAGYDEALKAPAAT